MKKINRDKSSRFKRNVKSNEIVKKLKTYFEKILVCCVIHTTKGRIIFLEQITFVIHRES